MATEIKNTVNPQFNAVSLIPNSTILARRLIEGGA